MVGSRAGGFAASPTAVAPLFSRLETVNLTGCVNLEGDVLAALAQPHSRVRYLGCVGCHAAVGAAPHAIPALVARGIPVRYYPPVPVTVANAVGGSEEAPLTAPAPAALRYANLMAFDPRNGRHSQPAGGAAGQQPLHPHAANAAQAWWTARCALSAQSKHGRASRPAATSSLRPSVTSDFSSRDEVLAHIDAGRSAREAEALGRNGVLCPLGCGVVSHGAGLVSAAGAAAAHVASGACALATYSCPACGEDVGATRGGRCASPQCDTVASSRQALHRALFRGWREQ